MTPAPAKPPAHTVAYDDEAEGVVIDGGELLTLRRPLWWRLAGSLDDLREAAELLRSHHMQIVTLTLPGDHAIVIDDRIRADLLDAAAAYRRGFTAIERLLTEATQ